MAALARDPQSRADAAFRNRRIRETGKAVEALLEACGASEDPDARADALDRIAGALCG